MTPVFARSMSGVLAMVALAACAMPNLTNTPSGGSSPAPKTSVKPTSSASPSTAPAPAGDSTVSLKIEGKDIPVVGPVTWSNTDVVGRRLRIGAVAGKSPVSTAGDVSVAFLFSGNQVQSLYPGWDVAKTAVYSAEVSYVDPAKNANRVFYLKGYPVTPPGSTLEAAEGHIKGSIKGEFQQQTTSAAGDTTRVPIELTFDLVQPAL